MGNSFRLVSWMIMAALVVGGFTPAPAMQTAPWQSKVDGWVLNQAARGETEFLVFLREQADLSEADQMETKLEKGQLVFQRLTETARRSQKPLLTALQQRGATFRPYWIANMIWVRGDMGLVQAMAQRPDVARIYANPSVHFDEPEGSSGNPGGLQAESATEVEWNIQKVKAPEVWAAGYEGQGAVIGGQDTGYDWNHPALKNQYRGWDGTAANHNYNWHDAIHSGGGSCGADSSQPCDDSTHGTHTMGTMVGNDGGSNQTGMAPGARWIGCRNMDQGNGTPATYSECYQWFLAPTDLAGNNPRPDLAPDVINNSWSCPDSEGCTDPNVLLTVVDNVRAAGIVTVHSAGNGGGPDEEQCGNVNTPSAIYEGSFTVGATNSNDAIANFSSRGPVTVDGSNRLKPNISAPGVGIRSSVPGGGYISNNGTSMAGPHVAGLVALVISAQPALAGNVEQIETLIEQSAQDMTTSQDCGGTANQVPNNVFGWGRIDSLAAMLTVPHSLTISKTASASTIAPGQTLTYTLEITHVHPVSITHNIVLTDVIPLGTEFLSATQPYTLTGETVRWEFDSLGANAQESVKLAVSVPVTATGVITNEMYGVRSDEAGPVSGTPVTTDVISYSLGIAKTGPISLEAGETLTYTLSLTNPHPTAAIHQVVISDVIPAGTHYFTATLPHNFDGNAVHWELASLGPGASASVELVVQTPITATGTIENSDYAAWGEEVVEPVTGPPVATFIVQRRNYLPLMALNHKIEASPPINN